VVAGGQGALLKLQLVSKEIRVLVPRFTPHCHRTRAAKRNWLGKRINYDSIPQAAADRIGKRWPTNRD
jgi:hypothetical protein